MCFLKVKLGFYALTQQVKTNNHSIKKLRRNT